MSAMDDAIAQIEARAGDVVEQTIEARFRRYCERPSQLDAIYPDLSRKSGPRIVALCDGLIEDFTSKKHRWVGFGGEVPLLNLKAARRYGLWLQRQEAA